MKNSFDKEKLDTNKLNEVIKLSSSILRITFLFFIITGIYALTLILKEWKILTLFLTILKILSPVFIGLFLAWLLDPFVKFLRKRGLNRVAGTVIVYIAMLGFLYLIVTSLFPLLLEQANDFLVILPSILDSVGTSSNKFLSNFKSVSIIDIEIVKTDLIIYINDVITSLTTEIPEMTIAFVKNLFSAVGIFALGLIIGFYLLFDFDNIGDSLISILPKRARNDMRSLFVEANTSLLAYIKGTLLVCVIVFVCSAVVLSLIGVRAALLLALIIGVADVIPYIGPYIGAFPAVLVAFTHSVPMGILTIAAMFCIQMLEGNFIQPLIMSRTMKLHPVSIIVGILVFGYFFGIVGMIIATPLVALIKMIAMFINRKYDIISIAKKFI